MKHGADKLTDQEILEICLYVTNSRNDTYNLAKRLLMKFRSLRNCMTSDPHVLQKIQGMGSKTIASFNVMSEFCRRFFSPTIHKKDIISGWRDVIEYCRVCIGHKNREHVLCLFLDSRNQVIDHDIHQVGTSKMVYIYPEEIIKDCVQNNAHSLILVHNHPTGALDPSRMDMKYTQKLQHMLAVVNITLHDHIIITSDGFFSFRNRNLLT